MKRVYLVIGVVLVTLNCFLLYRMSRLNDVQERITNGVEFQQESYFNLILNQVMNAPPITLGLPSTFEIISEKGEVTTVDQIIKNSAKIVLKISQYNCFDCIESQFKIINSFDTELEIIVLAQLNSIAEAKIIKEKTGLRFPIFVIKESLPFGSLEQLNVPYYFSIDNRSIASCFFIPDKNHPDLINKYLRSNLLKHRPSKVAN